MAPANLLANAYLVKQIIIKEPNIKNVSDIRARKHGSKVFIDIRICVDPYIDVCEGHEIAEMVEAIIKREIENVKDVVVHVDPHPINQEI